jgi:hypothetical protein
VSLFQAAQQAARSRGWRWLRGPRLRGGSPWETAEGVTGAVLRGSGRHAGVHEWAAQWWCAASSWMWPIASLGRCCLVCFFCVHTAYHRMDHILGQVSAI